MKNNLIIIAVVTLLVGGGVGFFAGMKYQQNQRPSFGGNFTGRMGATDGVGNGNTRGNFRPVNGEIINVDADSITVKLTNGGSTIVLLSSKTLINQSTAAAQSDLKVGGKIAVFGTTNTDGSVTAQSIQLNPQERMNPANATPSAK